MPAQQTLQSTDGGDSVSTSDFSNDVPPPSSLNTISLPNSSDACSQHINKQINHTLHNLTGKKGKKKNKPKHIHTQAGRQQGRK